MQEVPDSNLSGKKSAPEELSALVLPTKFSRLLEASVLYDSNSSVVTAMLQKDLQGAPRRACVLCLNISVGASNTLVSVLEKKAAARAMPGELPAVLAAPEGCLLSALFWAALHAMAQRINASAHPIT